MNADLINLRRVRKNKLRDENENQATQNRAKFGQSKAEKTLGEFDSEKLKSELDGKKRDTQCPKT